MCTFAVNDDCSREAVENRWVLDSEKLMPQWLLHFHLHFTLKVSQDDLFISSLSFYDSHWTTTRRHSGNVNYDVNSTVRGQPVSCSSQYFFFSLPHTHILCWNSQKSPIVIDTSQGSARQSTFLYFSWFTEISTKKMFFSVVGNSIHSQMKNTLILIMCFYKLRH